MIEATAGTTDRLMDLEKTVAALDDRLRNIQSGLWQSKPSSLTDRLLNLMSSKQKRAFMSAVCNRPVRPNMKVANHDSPRA